MHSGIEKLLVQAAFWSACIVLAVPVHAAKTHRHQAEPVVLDGLSQSATETSLQAEQPDHEDRRQPEFTRPETAAIREQMKQILADDKYVPRKSFMQSLWEFFFGRDMKTPKPSSSLLKFLYWFVIFWCVVTLIAILVHWAWALITVTRNRSSGSPSPVRPSEQVHQKSGEELHAMAGELAGQGDYYRAVIVEMLALLKMLDAKGIIRFHHSKTNGEYLKAFASSSAEFADFESCVNVYERSIYGRIISEKDAYCHMSELMKKFRAGE